MNTNNNHNPILVIMESDDTTIGRVSDSRPEAITPSNSYIMENKPQVTQTEAQYIFMEALHKSPEAAEDVLKIYRDILHVAPEMGR